MGEKCQRVWELFMDLTGLDTMELQRELNPIIKRLKIDLNNIQMDDIRRIVTQYMKKTLGDERLKSVAFEEEVERTPSYTHN
ncbi:MAG: hypothetical protein R3A80_02255 [Bdellovibrionota bacterium]